MDAVYHGFTALSVLLFLYYGSSALVSNAMTTEFERFGLSRYRKLTGTLEVLGAIGLILGYFIPLLVVAASGGLALLMVLGLATRYRAGDSLAEFFPAFVLTVINLYVLVYALGLAT
jgi:uncharacterized membrane protein YphA (DoxX/SURF4 family)